MTDPAKAHMYICFSIKRLKSQLMLKFYKKKITAVSDNCMKMMLMIEYCNKQQPETSKRFLQCVTKEKDIFIMGWPSHSLDNNPIENVLALTKLKLR